MKTGQQTPLRPQIKLFRFFLPLSWPWRSVFYGWEGSRGWAEKSTGNGFPSKLFPPLWPLMSSSIRNSSSGEPFFCHFLQRISGTKRSQVMCMENKLYTIYIAGTEAISLKNTCKLQKSLNDCFNCRRSTE